MIGSFLPKYSGFLVLTGTIVLTSGSCASDGHLPTEMPYTLIATSDASTGSQRRLGYAIVSPDASTLVQRAHTVRRAVRDLQTQAKADRIWVLLEPDEALKGAGYALAIAEMEKGMLTRLDAAPSTYSAQDVSVMSMVNKLQKQFVDDRTEDRRFAAVAEALHMPAEQVRESVRVFSRILIERHAYTDSGQ